MNFPFFLHAVKTIFSSPTAFCSVTKPAMQDKVQYTLSPIKNAEKMNHIQLGPGVAPKIFFPAPKNNMPAIIFKTADILRKTSEGDLSVDTTSCFWKII